MAEIDKRLIARNTLYLYLRTFISMIVSLFTSRLILEALGVTDFGILNVVGGVIVMMSFLNGSMSVATQRFLSYELGLGRGGQFSKVFSMAVYIHHILALLILIFGETVGLWFVNNYLVIPVDRMFAANCVYQTSIFVCLLGIIQTPYNAAIVAHEKMHVYAWFGLGETFLKLACVIILLRLDANRLVIWAAMLFGIQFTSAVILRIYCVYSIHGCKVGRRGWNAEIFHQMLGFTGWNMFGTIAWSFKDQGANILLNIFGGPAVNAARGVSGQVCGAVRNLISGFQSAVNPQLTKSYASGHNGDTCRLLCQSSKISFFLMLVISLPVMSQISFLLGIWLVEVPPYAAVFTCLVIVESLFDTLAGPMITALLATGRIKWYQIIVGSVLLLNIPISYLWLKSGGPIQTPLIVSIIMMLVGNATRLIFCRSMLGLSLRKYCRDVAFPVLVAFVIGGLAMVLVNTLMDEGWGRLFVSVATSLLVVGTFTYTLGLKVGERNAVRSMVISFVKG